MLKIASNLLVKVTQIWRKWKWLRELDGQIIWGLSDCWRRIACLASTHSGSEGLRLWFQTERNNWEQQQLREEDESLRLSLSPLPGASWLPVDFDSHSGLGSKTIWCLYQRVYNDSLVSLPSDAEWHSVFRNFHLDNKQHISIPHWTYIFNDRSARLFSQYTVLL